MIYDSATFIAYLGAIVFSASLIFSFATKLKTPSLRPIFATAAFAQTIWLVCTCFTLVYPTQNWIITSKLADSAQQLIWLWVLIHTMQKHCSNQLPAIFSRYFLPLSAFFVLGQLWLSHTLEMESQLIFHLPALAISMLGLLFINRLYCSTSNIRLLKLICVALAVLFAYNAYHTVTLLTGISKHDSASATRATITLLACLGLLIGTLTIPKESNEPHARLSLSRPVILYICLFSLSAAIITIFAFSGLYIRRFGGGLSEAIYLFIVATAIIAVVVLLTSTSFRNLLNVLINKHLFSHKYDYRSEWLKLIDGLSKPANSQEAYGIALNAVISIFKCPGGAIYLSKGGVFSLAISQNCAVQPSQTEPINSAFCRIFRESEWVFFPRLAPTNTSLDKFNEALPDWIRIIDQVWLVMPLIYETKLTGFIILNEPKIHTSLNWEDLDLLKITGRQIASYIEGHKKSEALSEAKQFETFNKLSAFVMHDLKNLIAQQSLLIENATKHKDNPAFIEDTFFTISGSVDRLNTLLQKLQRSEPEAARSIDLKPVIIEAVNRCSRTLPVPSLRLETDNLRMLAAPDTLCMVLIHVIQNAQEATKSSGFVDININRLERNIIIEVEDNGKGMDENFIKQSLFKPFETTKTGKGMGIGVYQAKDYIEHIGGTISVTSQVNVGTTFTITLPLLPLNEGT